MIKKMHLIWIALCPLYEHYIPAALAQNYCDSNHKHLWVYSPHMKRGDSEQINTLSNHGLSLEQLPRAVINRLYILAPLLKQFMLIPILIPQSYASCDEKIWGYI